MSDYYSTTQIVVGQKKERIEDEGEGEEEKVEAAQHCT
jgi:hypothetical protein